MRHKLFLVAIIAACLLVAAMYFFFIYDNSHHAEGEYLSFTASQLIGDDELEATVYEYNLRTNKIAEIYQFPVSAMYSLGVYDKAENRVFYVQERDNNTFERKRLGDQIYMHHLSTGEDRILTDDLLAVNFILPAGDIVFFLAAKLDHPNLIVGRIDLTTGNIRYWNESPSASSRVLSIDRERERIYVSMYDAKEDDAYSSGESEVMPTHTIYSYDYNLSDTREILRTENMNIRTVCAEDNVLMYNVLDTFTPQTATYAITQVIDLDSMEVLFETDDCFSQGRLASDAGTYLLAGIGDFVGIAYLDFATLEYTPVIESGQNMNGDIVNFQVMRATQ